MWHARAIKVVGNFLLALMICLSMVVVPSEQPVKGVSILVNTLSDLPDYAPLDGVCETAMGTGICTLRAAIQTAYQFDTIDFDDDLNGYTIYLNHSGVALESLILAMNDVTIDGDGHNITISGEYMSNAPGADMECLRIAGNFNTVRYLTFRDCASWGIVVGDGDYGDSNAIYAVTLLGNSSGGIAFNEDDGDGLGGNDNYLQYSLIGTTSSSPSSCIVADENSTGVAFGKWVHGNHIEHSTIACNAFDGVDFYDADNNYIHGSVIGGNGWNGVYMIDASYITMTENSFGVDAVGLGSLGNGNHGIYITGGSDHGASRHITIGGNSTSDSNLIGGNIYSGIYITGNSYDIDINNNVIGLSAYLDTAIPNGNAGIAIEGNTIDGSLENAIVIGDDAYTTSHQYISGNTNEGIYISNSNNVRIKDSNLIGRGDFSASPEVALGNGWEGVFINNSHHITVGGYAIAYNGWQGVGMVGDLSLNNQVKPLRVYANGGLGIDLNEDGFTPNDLNDSDAGPNTLLNYPVVTGISGGILSGTVCADCRVYFFLAKGDPSKGGGGYVDNNLGYVTADGSGFWSVPYPLGTGVTVNKLAMLSLHVASGTTSEVSPRPQIYIPLVKK